MATFLGWEIITMPTSPAAPASVEFTDQDIVAISVSPFSGQQQSMDWQSGRMEWSLSYPALTETQERAWSAFFKLCRGRARVFQFGHPRQRSPRGSGAGTPLVNGANQTGYALLTKGWTHSATGVLLAGDWLQIGYRLYCNLETANADGSGNATLNIWPALRESPANSAAITLNNTQGMWRLKSNSRKLSLGTARVYGMQFDIEEAI